MLYRLKQASKQLQQEQRNQDGQENAINVANQWRDIVLKPVDQTISNFFKTYETLVQWLFAALK